MATRPSPQLALMSIHPHHADAILAGTKKVEFRRRPPMRDVDWIVLYSTKPVSAVVGAFVVGERVHATPGWLWRRFHSVAGVDRPTLLAYFDGVERGFGLTVSEVVAFKKPIPLRKLDPALSPPQSYVYLNGVHTRRLELPIRAR